jgi:hypothetical protein
MSPIAHSTRELRDLSVVQQLLFIAERAPTQAVCESIEKIFRTIWKIWL